MLVEAFSPLRRQLSHPPLSVHNLNESEAQEATCGFLEKSGEEIKAQRSFPRACMEVGQLWPRKDNP